jgi:uncharacterized membrane protein YeaQ/YmgE (transglycosylase-associated protein family)
MSFMDIVAWVILGAAAGWIASIVTRTDEEQGGVGNVIVGIIGAFIGGLIVRLFGGSAPTGFSLPSLLTAILGAVVLLYVIRGFRRSRV